MARHEKHERHERHEPHKEHHERHHRARGGKAEVSEDEEWDGNAGDDTPDKDTKDVYAGQESRVRKEADGDERKRGGKVKHHRKERKHGGRTHKMHGGDVALGGEKEHKVSRKDERIEKKHGGRAHEEKLHGEAARPRLDRAKRKSGGGVGADTSPLSTAAKISERRGDDEDKRTQGG